MPNPSGPTAAAWLPWPGAWPRDWGGWQLFDEEGKAAGNYERLLITIPASQAIDLIQASQLPTNLRDDICAQLGQARYNPLLSVMLGYRPRPQARPYYALVNTDKAHPISWLAWEHEKSPERVPAHSGLLIAQMAPPYSQEHWQTEQEELVRDVAGHVETLLAEPLGAPIFTDVQRWRYALPATKADARALNALTLPTGLVFCGDAFVGGHRVVQYVRAGGPGHPQGARATARAPARGCPYYTIRRKGLSSRTV